METLEEKVSRLSERVDQIEQRFAGLSFPSFPAWPGAEARPPAVPSTSAEMTQWPHSPGSREAHFSSVLSPTATRSSGVGVALGMVFAAAWSSFLTALEREAPR